MWLFAPAFAYGACSVQNLTRCLDSVCAINIGANPAARCQYCGTESSGEPTKSNAMKSISAGTSAKYTISDKELKNAPKSPGQRYVWGTRLCLEKLPECTADDVTDNYDALIEQSCKAAGISAEIVSLAKKATSTKTQTACSTEVNTCMINEKHCNADYKRCESDSDFDKFFSDCSVTATGCDSFLSDIRKSLISSRDTTIANADKVLQNIVTAYKNAREQRLVAAQNSCKNDLATKNCIAVVCDANMPNKCKSGYEDEKTLVTALCEYHKIACTRLK